MGIVSRNQISVDEQIKIISERVGNQIVLVDDVVFSGNVLKDIINRFKKYNIEIVKIISCISSIDSYNYFKNNLKYGIDTLYLMDRDVIDQVCERDFYFGIAGSGIYIKKDNHYYKSPYFKPFGNPNKRASIPLYYEDYFSISCINRSIYLWESIEKLKQDKIYIKELPEEIINTNKNDEVIKILKRSRLI